METEFGNLCKFYLKGNEICSDWLYMEYQFKTAVNTAAS